MATEKTYYIVQYNDSYGNGNDKKIEVIVKNKEDFGKWLKQHNNERKLCGEFPESHKEFDLIPTTLFENKN
jgi:hypothetical protein